MIIKSSKILRIVVLFFAWCAGLSAAVCQADVQGQDTRMPIKSFDAKQRVVACSSNGRFVLTKANGWLTVWKDGSVLSRHQPLVAKDKDSDSWYAISNDGNRFVENKYHYIRMMDRKSSKRIWELLRPSDRIFDYPVFSPDDSWLALPETGRVSILKADTGQVYQKIGAAENYTDTPTGRYATIPNEGIALARGIYFSADSRWVAITSASSGADSSNLAVFVASVTSGKIVAQCMGHPVPVADVLFLSPERILTLDETGSLKLFSNSGLLLRSLPQIFNRPIAHTLAADPELNTVLIGDILGSVWMWRAKDSSVTCLRQETGCPVRSMAFHPQDEQVAVLDQQGRFDLLPTGDIGSGGKQLAWEIFETSPELMNAEAAIWSIGRPDNHQAVEALKPFAADAGHGKLCAAYHYADWIDQGRRQNFNDYWDPQPDLNGLLELAAGYVENESLEHGVVLFSAWLAERKKYGQATALDKRGRDIGLELAEHLEHNGDAELQARIVGGLWQIWPDDKAVANGYIDALQRTNPAEAMKAAQSLADRYPQEIASWTTLVYIAAEARTGEIPAIIEKALKKLDPDKAGTWGFLGYAYFRQGKKAEAIAAYSKAHSLDPANTEYPQRLKSLTGQ
jgi:tetratricopeptide (TPR) repeat protein